MPQIVFNTLAYCKIILHTAKYPHCSVNGILLSKIDSKGINRDLIEFVDAIPLCHIGLNLTPMAEIALMQIDEVASKRDLMITGYYIAHENPNVISVDKLQHRISDRIAMNFPAAYLVMVDNNALNLKLTTPALNVAQFNESNYKMMDKKCITLSSANTLDICSELLTAAEYNKLMDFDNHLDDVKCNWLNPVLNNLITDYSSN